MFIMIIWVLGWFIAGFLGGWIVGTRVQGHKVINWAKEVVEDNKLHANVQFVEPSIAKEQLEQATSLKDLI